VVVTVAPGLVDRSGKIDGACRGAGGRGGGFLDSSDGLGGGARTTCRCGGICEVCSGIGSREVGFAAKPKVLGSLAARGGPAGGGLLRICSETCLCAGGGVAENPRLRGSRADGRSLKVLALAGIGACGRSTELRESPAERPRPRGSRGGAVTVREKPAVLASFIVETLLGFGSEGSFCKDCEISWAAGGLREPGLSSLSGGVEKGDNRASEEGRRFVGCKATASLTGICRVPVGFAGIFGFSARFTGGGAFDVVAEPGEDSAGACWLSQTVASLGVEAGLAARLACCDTKSLTLPKGVTSGSTVGESATGAGNDLGGDRGDSMFTEGVSCGEDCKTMDMGRLWPNLGGD
jgi:hypothetical protein